MAVGSDQSIPSQRHGLTRNPKTLAFCIRFGLNGCGPSSLTSFATHEVKATDPPTFATIPWLVAMAAREA
jgi:hypothetical protein